MRKVKDKVRAKFGVRIAEVGGLDTWQRAVLGFAVVSGDAEYARGEVDSVIRYIEDMGVGNLVRADRETMTYDDEGLA